jgi:hypothetical protein
MKIQSMSATTIIVATSIAIAVQMPRMMISFRRRAAKARSVARILGSSWELMAWRAALLQGNSKGRNYCGEDVPDTLAPRFAFTASLVVVVSFITATPRACG